MTQIHQAVGGMNHNLYHLPYSLPAALRFTIPLTPYQLPYALPSPLLSTSCLTPTSDLKPRGRKQMRLSI